MNLQEKCLSSFETFENKEDILKDIRLGALNVFKEKGFPTRGDEAWRFTMLPAVLKNDFSVLICAENKINIDEIKEFFIAENSYKIVFVDGKFCKELSKIETSDFDFSLVSEVLKSDKKQEFIENYFNKNTHKNDVFTCLNTAFVYEGFFIEVKKNKAIEKPIEVLYITSDLGKAVLTQPRSFVVLGENSQIKIIESHRNLSQNPVLTNAVTEIFVGQDAIFDLYKVQNDNLVSSIIDNTFISQEKNSHAYVHTFCFGGEVMRNNLNFYHKGEYLDSTLKGVTILDGHQHADHYTLVNHAEPNCESHQDYKTILSGRSTAVFNGKIMVEPVAQKTNAYQQNDTILLSDKATMNTKPQLEIFADDVKCSHGCTIGELNKEALFYLKTRGIGQKQAEALLTFAFANKVLESVKIEELHDYLSEIISKKVKV